MDKPEPKEEAGLARVVPAELLAPVQQRGIKEAEWRTLAFNLFPGAKPQSVLMVWDYCIARKLDPLKKPCHIVPMEVKIGDDYVWRDVVMPGIYEYRTTAHRTGEYCGHDKPVYGPPADSKFGVNAPAWCEYTVYRWNREAREKMPFPVQIFFDEVVATRKDKRTGEIVANARWSRSPIQMLTKCAEAAALREAFPEEIGGEPTAEEMDGQRAINVTQRDATPETDEEAPEMVLFSRLPEPVRDNIEKAFALAALTNGKRRAAMKEYLLKPETDLEEQAAGLLTWLEDEFAKRRTGMPVKRTKDANGKTVPESVKASEAKGAHDAGTGAAGNAVATDAPAAEKPVTKQGLGSPTLPATETVKTVQSNDSLF